MEQNLPTTAGVPLESDQIADLIAMIRESADKLHADRIDRGDLKILSRTLRELRYAFKVFASYRGRRKVTRRPISRPCNSARPWLSATGWW